MTKAVIFDIDGTILDSVDLHAKAWQEAFAHFGYSFFFESIRAQIGKGGDQLLPVFMSEEDQKSRGDAIKEFRSDLFKKKYLSQVKPFPGVRDLFLTVKSHGQQTALASSAKGDEIEIFAKIAQWMISSIELLHRRMRKNQSLIPISSKRRWRSWETR